ELKEVLKEVELIIEDSNIDEEEATMQTDFEEKNTKHSEKEFSEEAYGAESRKNSPAKWIVNDKSLGTQLSDEKDWEKFLSVRISKHNFTKKGDDGACYNQTYNIIYTLIVLNNYLFQKKVNLSDERTKIATNIMLLTQKNHCDEHDRACYVTGSHHLFLTPQHLSTWAASIEHNLATIDTPPSFPIFANKTVRSNQSNSQPLPPQASILQHTLFSYTITIFLNESIDVLDILDLNDSDFIKLGINSIGIRKKLGRSAKNYAQF
ncbi:9264_t:CDS:2, partial [Rhizophagus irregularis]